MKAMRKSEIETPALLIDLDAFERNIEKMAAFFKSRTVKLRPHFKCHRIVEVARLQLEAGAIGITCATLSEAELLVCEGIKDVLIANEIADDSKIRRLAELSRVSGIIVAVDSEDVLLRMSRAARRAGTEINVLVDVDVGLHRCGVRTIDEAVRLAQSAVAAEGIRFRGLMGYEGHLQALCRGAGKTRLCEQAMSKLIEARRAVESAGIEVEIVSAGGTGTYHITGKYAGVTEIQAGSYAFMDTFYRDAGADFELASTVLATVLSRPERDKAVANAGLKSIHPLFGKPEVKCPEGVRVRSLNAEHTNLILEGADLSPGDRVELYVPYVDGTFNLHPVAYFVRGDEVVHEWKIRREASKP